MSVQNYSDLADHYGHSLDVAIYGDQANIAIECENCNEVLIDFDNVDLDTVPCYICKNEIDLEDSVWADSKGNVDNPLYAYCVSDLPSQLEEY
jgi:hypothetical protein